MCLVSNTKILKQAQLGNYAVGAFNIENMEMAQAVIKAAEEMSSPVILQTTPSTLNYANPSLFSSMVSVLACGVNVPIVLHLDHGNSLELCKSCIESGYTSIMFDGSKSTFEENVVQTSEVVKLCNKFGVSSEAELGTVGGKEDSTEASISYTDPNEALLFANKTHVDSFAVAIGTSHGFYKGKPLLDFDRLKEIRYKVDTPLVLHGASGLPDNDITKAISLGICKVNFATELRFAYTQSIRDILCNKDIFDPKKYGDMARAKVKDLVKSKMILCGCAGKA